MSEMTISVQDIITLAAIIAAVGGIYAVVSKPFKAMHDVKDSLEKITETVEDISEDQKMQGDMIYQLLSHAATNNNTGEMQRALNQYNEYYRH